MGLWVIKELEDDENNFIEEALLEIYGERKMGEETAFSRGRYGENIKVFDSKHCTWEWKGGIKIAL